MTPSLPIRAVIDTNIVVSALIFGSRLSQVRLSWQTVHFIPLIYKTTVTELIRVLAYPKFKLTPKEQENLLADYVPFCETVVLPQQLPTVPECRDPYDIPFLLLATVAEADYLVSGDKDLLALKDDFDCLIVTAEEFMNVLR